MSIEKTLYTTQRQAGVSLIELMISIALGLLLLSAATAMTVSSMVMNADTLKSARLNQNLDSVLHAMVNDIRRAGYSGGRMEMFEDYPSLHIAASRSCVLYAYNANDSLLSPDTILDENERFGFKLVGSEIHMRTSCLDADLPACATDCGKGIWVPLIDSSVAIIDFDDTDEPGLKFSSFGSKCISLTAASEQNNFWITTATDATDFPCMAADGTGLDTWVANDAGDYASGGTFAKASFDDRLIEARQVNIDIKAQLTNDPTMRKHQVVAISARNDQIYIIPPE